MAVATATQTLKTKPTHDDRMDSLELTFDILTSSTGGASLTEGASTDYGMFYSERITDVIKGREISYAEVRPGGTTPTDAFDVVINDDQGTDLFGGEFADCTSGSVTSSYCYNGTTYGSRRVRGPITPLVTNAGNSKTLSIVISFE